MKIYTLKELESDLFVVSIDSLEEADQLTALCKEIDPYEVTMTEWVSNKEYRKEILSQLINKDQFIQISLKKGWSLKRRSSMHNETTIVTVNQVQEYVDRYSSKPKKQTKNLNQQKEVKQMKKYLRVFSKGQLNVEGLFYQIEKEGKIEEPRAFVRELIGKEVERVREEADKLDFKKLKAKFVKRYNIQAVGALETMEEIRSKGSFTSAIEDVLLVLSYYEFQKQKDNKVVYDWIKPYLTQKVLSNPKETVLFESKHRKIFIKAGTIKLQEAKRAMISNVDIKYDKESDTFSL